MIKSNKKGGIVYSTNPDFKPYEDEEENSISMPAAQQKLYVRLDRLKGGKVATVVENYLANEEDFSALAKELKAKCGVGGSAKDGEIILQGDHRDKVISLLTAKGFSTKKKGG